VAPDAGPDALLTGAKGEQNVLNSPALTAQQQEAVAARGNVLVVAGAGAGKTRTLVDRCLAWLLDEQIQGSVDEILMVTFTQAAAAEMRKRLRDALERAQASSARLAEQLALLETAHICTLHSFCFELVSQHFYELGLDPQLTVMCNEESHALARRTLDEVLEAVYDAEAPADVAIQRLIQATGGDWDQPVRDLIGRLHRYAQTLRDPARWFAEQEAVFQSPQPEQWRNWLMAELNEWRASWLPRLQRQPPANQNATRCAAALERCRAAVPAAPHSEREEFATALAQIGEIDQSWPRPKSQWRDPIKDFFEEADFLQSVCALSGKTDPLAEDWNWTRPSMLALLDAARRFGAAFAQAKRNAGSIDFQDLEQFALRLLWSKERPSEIAQQWRRKLRLIFVDEFQDINGAQEAIIQALAREGADANRFLVGDVKQSIYRFRLADPHIFVNYKALWAAGGPDGRVLGLSENFRSHEGILAFVNALFAPLMRESIGGVNYDEAARLRFGGREHRASMSSTPSIPAPVELLLRRLGESNEDDEAVSDAEKEARLVGRRLLELHGDPARPVPWKDMVILLRAPRNKTAAYAKEFSRLGIPLAAARGGFYESAEVRDLLALLQLLDNPLQDLPLLGVLRSPLVGMTAGELADIRAAQPHGRFWNALVDWQRAVAVKTPGSGAAEKAGRFLQRYRLWRRQARQEAVSHCLENIIDSTHYADWLQTRPRGEPRRANLDRLLQLARQFDANRGESLPRFLRFVETQQESEEETEPAAAHTDAVRLMSIHQSKGLEFPVVVAADLGKRFHWGDLRAHIILDEEYGLCPRVRPPEASQTWPSLPYWLARRRQKRELLGEEMRLLYVALTRAGHRLILAGTASRKSIEEKWPKRAGEGAGPAEILASASYLDWLGSWPPGAASLAKSGQNEFFTWTVYEDDHPWLARSREPSAQTAEEGREPDLSPDALDRLDWRYPFEGDTHIAAKAAVSDLRREIAGEEEEAPLFAMRQSAMAGTPRCGVRSAQHAAPAFTDPAEEEDSLTAAEIGLAHHAFLERVALERAHTLEGLREEAARLRRENLLTTEQCACLDLEALAAFWQSEPGCQFLDQLPALRRELAFTARLEAAELARLGAVEFAGAGAGEFVVVQGVIDLAAILTEEIWLLDFKTDHFPARELNDKTKMYRPQIELYAAALSRIHGRPVTRRWLHFLAHRHTARV
jgi:ATP-dependent helicase/nuclease subunit A